MVDKKEDKKEKDPFSDSSEIFESIFKKATKESQEETGKAVPKPGLKPKPKPEVKPKPEARPKAPTKPELEPKQEPGPKLELEEKPLFEKKPKLPPPIFKPRQEPIRKPITRAPGPREEERRGGGVSVGPLVRSRVQGQKPKEEPRRKSEKPRLPRKKRKGSPVLKIILLLVLLAAGVGAASVYFGILDVSDYIAGPEPATKEAPEVAAPKGPPVQTAAKPPQPEAPKSTEQAPPQAKPAETPLAGTQPKEVAGTKTVPALSGTGVSYPYSVYLGSVQGMEYVKRAMSIYENQGLSIYWSKVELGEKGTSYRLFTGYFRSAQEAEAFIQQRKIKEGEVKETRYSNLIGAFGTKQEGEEKALALAKQGLSAYLVPASDGWVRLCSGAFITREGAEKNQAELNSMVIKSQIVER